MLAYIQHWYDSTCPYFQHFNMKRHVSIIVFNFQLVLFLPFFFLSVSEVMGWHHHHTTLTLALSDSRALPFFSASSDAVLAQ